MDFLLFKQFISIEALIVFYYIGAVIFPVAIYFLASYLVNKYIIVEQVVSKGKQAIWSELNKNQRIKLIVLAVFVFLLGELFWRMLFEFLIAYIQIRDALMQA